MRRLRGSVVLTASPQGLFYSNAMATPPDRTIARSDIGTILVVPAHVGVRRVTWRIEARGHAGDKTMLVTGKDRAALEAARDAILQAMGITNPIENSEMPEDAVAALQPTATSDGPKSSST